MTAPSSPATARPTRAVADAFFFNSTDGARLFGVWREAHNAARAWVFCPPFAEEEKSARRTLAEIADALAAKGAVLELSIDGGTSTPAVLKDAQRHPVRGDLLHVDLLRVDLNVAIQAPVTVELVGGDEAPGVVEGGILEHVTREVNVEALPTDIPDSVMIDVSALEMNETFMLSQATIPSELTLLDDAEETVVATISAPTKVEEPEAVEEETEVVGEGEAPAEAEGSDESEGDGE